MNAELHSGDVVSSISIEGLLLKRASVVSQLTAARAGIAEIERYMTDGGMFTEEYRRFSWIINGTQYTCENHLLSDDAMPKIIARLDASCWSKLMHESGLLTFMDAKARADFREKIDKCQTPPLTRENIEETFRSLYNSRDDMFDRGVIACFKKLSWDYKTNNPVKFGKRIIKTYLTSYGSFSHSTLNDLDDLQRVFRVVEGKPEEDHRNCLSSRMYALNGRSNATGTFTDEYMAIKWFKNGNGHITFLKERAVDKLNSIIAKHYPGALPAVRS
jgi:hypothetical protein